MALMFPKCTGRRQTMLTAFSAAQNRQTCRFKLQINLN